MGPVGGRSAPRVRVGKMCRGFLSRRWQIRRTCFQIARIAGFLARTSHAPSRGMTNNTSFWDLKVWRQAMALVEDVYRLSARFPAAERFGLTSQVRRAAVSIPSNIGERKRRKRQRAFLHHLDIALGSQGEVEVQLEIAQRLGFATSQEIEPVASRVAEVGRMLNGLIEALQLDRPGDGPTGP